MYPKILSLLIFYLHHKLIDLFPFFIFFTFINYFIKSVINLKLSCLIFPIWPIFKV